MANRYCPNCGEPISEGVKFCVKCGTLLSPYENNTAEAEAPVLTVRMGEGYGGTSDDAVSGRRSAYTPYAAASIPAAPQPVPKMITEDTEPRGSRYTPMGAWDYVGSILLLGLPLAGLIICIVWACSDSINRNRRNLARAYLLLMAISLIITTVLTVIFYSQLYAWANAIYGLLGFIR